MGRFLIAVGIGLALLSAAIARLNRLAVSTSLPSLWAQGLGKTHAYLLMNGFLAFNNAMSNKARVIHVMTANSFQLLVSFLYLFYNNILTHQIIADELISFLREKKTLRVSFPQHSLQRSSYFLSLPWRYALPLMIAFTTLHWLVSQSVFTVQTTAYGPGQDGAPIPATNASRLGYSPLGILLTTILGAILILALIANSCRRYMYVVPAPLPRMATDSSTIRALCCSASEDREAHLYPVQLGIVIRGLEGGIPDGCEGRLAFSTDTEMVKPEEGHLYEFVGWDGPRQDVAVARASGFTRAAAMWRSVGRRLRGPAD